MFTSDLIAVLWTLQETRANCIISTEGTASGVSWQAQLTLSEGRVTFCQVRNSAEGQVLLTDSTAVRWLARQGTLSWEQMDARHLLSSPRSSQADPFYPHAVPQRLTVLEQGGMNSWSRKQRQVFGLVDGKRSLERIALMLRQPLSVIREIMHDLHAKGVIAVDRVKSEVKEEEGIS